MNIPNRNSKPIISLLIQAMIIIIAAALWSPIAMALPNFFTTDCAGCHGANAAAFGTITLDNAIQPETTCVSCHEHAAKDKPKSNAVTFAAQPQQPIVTPEATFKVNITGGNIGSPRNGQVRLRLYDAANTLLSDGHGTVDANNVPGGLPSTTIDATAPATTGQVIWQAAWLGNTRIDGPLDTSTWPENPIAKSSPHGERRVDFSFFVCEDNDSDGFFSATCLAPGITLDCDDADATKTTVCPVIVPPTPTPTPTPTPINSQPIADAGLDQTVKTADLVVLNGSLSNDIDGPVSPLAYSWAVISVPAGSTAVLSNAAAVMPSFTTDLLGAYEFELIVNDGLDDSVSSSVTITAEAGNAKPVADAGMDQAVLVNELVTLDGSGSTDADGDGLSFSWVITLSPNNSAVVLSNATTAAPTLSPDLAGEYKIELIVNDSFVDSVADTVVVMAGQVNTKPVANAGADQAAIDGSPATLDGSGSSDANNDPLTYTWTIMASPEGSTAALSESNVVMPSLTTDMAGVHVVALVVNDGIDDSEADTVMVMVGGENTAPVANAGMNQTVVENDNVMLDGSGSVDADGNTLTFNWSFTSSPVNDPNPMLTNSDTATPTFPANVTGTYIAQLIVNDSIVDSEPATVTITVGDGNTPPAANAGPDQAVFSEDTVALDGSASTDADGDPLTYSWTITSIPPGSTLPALSDSSSVKPSFAATAIGDYITQLTVNDGKANSMVDTVIISVDAANVKPVADAGPDQATTVDIEVSLDGIVSSDADGDILTFSWSFTAVPQGSGTPLFSDPTAEMPSFIPDVIGEYVAQLIVNDGIEDSDPDTVIINVEIGNTRPLANAGIEQTVMFSDSITVDGSASSDADDDVLTYRWTINTQPAGSNLSNNLADLTTVQLMFQADVTGEYVFQLIVNDGIIDSLPNTVMVTVIADNVVAQAVEEPLAEAPVATDPEPSTNPENITAQPIADMTAILATLMEMMNALLVAIAAFLASLQM